MIEIKQNGFAVHVEVVSRVIMRREQRTTKGITIINIVRSNIILFSYHLHPSGHLNNLSV
jgi:hypothetical protein